MKANEAPEKLYLLPDDRNPNGLSICWYEAPYVMGSIEYTRTDAFIEKAWDWIEKNIKDYIIVDIDNKYEGVDGLFSEDFRNFMKKNYPPKGEFYINVC